VTRYSKIAFVAQCRREAGRTDIFT
jgi:hypothetical protein